MSTSTAVEDEITVGTHDSRRVLRWNLGGSLRGLTTAGQIKALQAAATWMQGLDAKGKAALAAAAPGVQITTQSWTMPCIVGQEQKVADLMVSVLRADGSIGQL